jgi:uncharacterized protein YjaZ
MNQEPSPILITPVRGKAYLWRPRNWSEELAELLKSETRLTPDRIEYFRQFAGGDNAHRAFAAAQAEAAGYPVGFEI